MGKYVPHGIGCELERQIDFAVAPGKPGPHHAHNPVSLVN